MGLNPSMFAAERNSSAAGAERPPASDLAAELDTTAVPRPLQRLVSPRLSLRQGLQMLAKPFSEDFAAGLASGHFQDDVLLLLNRGHNLVTVQH
jgi:hypothetical protein